MLENNSIFNEKYRIECVIGQGGMGIVYKAKHITLGNEWAIKEMTYDSSQLDLLAEPDILKILDHPALPKITDIVWQNNTVYIIMNYINGKDLKVLLKERGKFTEKEVISFAKQLCEVLRYLHNHKSGPIIYRDMKPDNVMMTGDNKLVLIDFGIARKFKEESKYDTVLGYTKGYAAPEQQNREGQSDGRTDIYSLGVTLYHLITGRSPFEPPYDFTKVREIDNSLSEGIEYIIRKCVQKDPDDRYQNVDEILNDLNNIYKLNSTYKKSNKIYYLNKVSSIAFLTISILTLWSGIDTLGEERVEKYYSIIEEGIELRESGNYDEAINKFYSAKNIKEKLTDSYKEVAKTYLYEKEEGKCIEYLEGEVLSENNECLKDDELQYILATAYFNLKDYEKSTEHFEKAIEINPLNIVYKRDYAVSLGKNNKVEEAEEVVNKIREDSNSNDIIEYLQGEINFVKGNLQEAISNFESCIDKSIDEELKIKAYKSMVKLYANNKSEFENSEDKQLEVVEKAKNDINSINDAEFIELEGSAYFNKAQAVKDESSKYKEYLKKSADSFEALIDKGYKMPYLYSNIGNIYHYMGEYFKAEKYLNDATILNENDSSVYVDLALLYADIENSKSEDERNYDLVIENYELAKKYAKEGEKDPKLAPLNSLVTLLRENGWID